LMLFRQLCCLKHQGINAISREGYLHAHAHAHDSVSPQFSNTPVLPSLHVHPNHPTNLHL
jgi:hypothetical protein